MYRREHRSTDDQPRRVGQVVVVKSCQQVEVDFVVVENVSVDAHQPNQIDEVPQAPPYREGFLEIQVSIKVYLEVHNDEDNRHYD